MNDQVGAIPPNIQVDRVFALDVARDLSIRGYYPFWAAMTDEWWTWLLGAVPRGLNIIRRHNVDAIWSTFPILTAHLIGLTLHRITGLPWIADFRDSMSEEGYPRPHSRFKVHRWLEGKIVKHCTRAIFTTPGARRMYAERYPLIPKERWGVIANGYDEEAFAGAEKLPRRQTQKKGPVVLLHSGVLYPYERDPRSFYASLADLRKLGKINPDNLKIVLRGSGHDDYHQRQIAEYGIGDIVRLEKSLPYREALSDMLQADGLLIFQADHCNHMIPAKVYEYLRCRRPILALTDWAGDTANLLRENGVDTIVPLDSVTAISEHLIRFMQLCRTGTSPLPDPAKVRFYSRTYRTRELAELLDCVLEERNGRTSDRGRAQRQPEITENHSY
jgi:glycosyltransferase involved in cell wall biosynthesis